MSDSILIIGATGSIGLEIATRLSNLNLSVKIAARNPEKAKSRKLTTTELVHFDYNMPETFENAFEDVEKMLLVSPPSYLKMHEVVINAINKAISKGVKLIVNISAISIDSNLDKPMKLIEDHIKRSEVDYVFLRPNCYMQNFRDLFRDLIIEDGMISLPAENSKTSFVDIRDVADVAVKALTVDNMKNSLFKLTGKQLLNMHVVAHLFSEGLNKEINYNSISEELFEKTLRIAGWSESTIEGTMQLCNHVKNGETDLVSDDVEKILNRESIRFEKFIKDYSDIWA